MWGISIQHSSSFRNRTMLLDIFVKAFTNRWNPQSFRYSHIYKQNYVASSGFIAKKMCAKYFCVVSHCFKLSRGLTASPKVQLMFKTETEFCCFLVGIIFSLYIGCITAIFCKICVMDSKAKIQEALVGRSLSRNNGTKVPFMSIRLLWDKYRSTLVH